MSPKSLPVVLGVVLACVTAAAPARADGPTRLWLEARPFTCDAQLPALARELTLACDAAGGACVIAPSESVADRHIVVHCGEEAWTVEATSRAGQRAWSVEVYGSDDDRARSAAVFTVRAESGEAIPHQVSAASAAPSDSPGKPPGPPSLAPGDHDRVETSAPTSIFSVAAAPRISAGFGHGDTHLMSGVAGYGAVRLNRFFRAGITGSVEAGEGDPNDPPSAGIGMHWHVSGGGLLGIGAPFDRVPFGAVVEGTYGMLAYTERVGVDVQKHFASVRAGLVYQLYETSAVRPWLCVSGRQTWTSESVGSLAPANNYASVDLGVVWDP